MILARAGGLAREGRREAEFDEDEKNKAKKDMTEDEKYCAMAAWHEDELTRVLPHWGARHGPNAEHEAESEAKHGTDAYD